MRLLFATLLASSLLLAGCTTVIPKAVKDNAASLDGNTANSGFLFFNPDGSGTITTHARDRYNALVATYGARFTVPLTTDAGITPGPVINGKMAYIIDAQHLEYFARMNTWRKAGK